MPFLDSDIDILGEPIMPSATVVDLRGNNTVAGINGSSPSEGTAWVVTDSGTLTLGSLSVNPGDLVEFDGSAWAKLVPNVGGFVAEGTFVILSSSSVTSPYTGSQDEGKVAIFSGQSNTADLFNVSDGTTVMVNPGSACERVFFVYADGVGPGAGGWQGTLKTKTPVANAHVTPKIYVDTATLSEWTSFQTRTSNPAATDRVPVNDTNESFWTPGRPIRWRQGATIGYGVIIAVTPNVNVQFAGRAIATGTPIDEFDVGPASRVVRENLFVGGGYAGAIQNNISINVANHFLNWNGAVAYLVDFIVRHKQDDGGGNGNVNPRVNGANVSTLGGGNGPSPSAAGWSASNGVNLNPGNYAINYNQGYDIDVKVADAAGGSAHLTAVLTWVME